ncbi:ESC reductase [Aureobasidium pullulans]|nr:ESC reductase [Aureobasidium pullulans]
MSVVPSSSLEGKVAVVTGSSRGIGAAIALELAQRGARVAVNYLNSVSDAEQVVKRIKDLGNGSDAALFQANVDNVEEIGKLMDNVVAHFGRLDICCSNAGVHSSGHFSDVKADDFDRTFTTNTRAQFFVAQEAYKRMEVGGRIIFMSSITAQAKSIPEHAVYAGSKGAIESFARCMAVDAGEKKVTVNCVAPGGIKTDMFYSGRDKVVPDDEKGNVDVYISKLFPHNRIGETCDVSRVVAFLASQDGEWVNGKVIGIDGGANM